MGFLKRLLGKESAKIQTKKCDVCSAGVEDGMGYALSAEQIARSGSYWEYLFGKAPKQYELALIVIISAKNSWKDMWDSLILNFPVILNYPTPWLVCDRCIELFSVDKGRCHSISKQLWSCRGGWEKDIGAASKITAIEGIIKGLIRRAEVIKDDDLPEFRSILARLQAEKGEEILEKKATVSEISGQTKGSGLHSLSLGDSMQSDNSEDGDIYSDSKDDLGRTALMYAAHNNQFDIVSVRPVMACFTCLNSAKNCGNFVSAFSNQNFSVKSY